jgi:hypothetical protein
MSGRDFKPAPVKVDIGGQERELHFDLNALVEIEDRFGSVTEVMKVAVSFKNIRFLVWAGLLWKEQELTEKEVGKWFTINDLPPITEAVMNALLGSMPKADEKNG